MTLICLWKKQNISIYHVSLITYLYLNYTSKNRNWFILKIYFFNSVMVRQIEQIKKDKKRNGSVISPISPNKLKLQLNQSSNSSDDYEVVALHISPDLGERILMSTERSVLDEIFPETNQAILDARSGVAWNQFDGRQVIRFPLNGYCKLNSIQVLTRLLNAGFTVEASTGGGVESQQFSEYLLIRKVNVC